MGVTINHSFALLNFALLSVGSLYGYEVKKFGLLLPNTHSFLPEMDLCSGIKLNSTTNHYIVGFEPQATKDIVHHMVLYGCSNPGSTNPIWSCHEEMGRTAIGNKLETHRICNRGRSVVLYAWAKNAPKLELPPEVGFKVGGNSSIQYLVLQIHYAGSTHNSTHNSKTGSSTDRPGVLLKYTEKPMSKLAGVFLLGAGRTVPALSEARWETACTIVENKTIHPFAFRPHAHWLGTVLSGYVVKRDSNGKDHWTLVGKQNPQLPHMFYPAANIVAATKGDTLAARCTYKSNRNYTTFAGSLDHDEMCNFYYMYYVEEGEPMKMKYCFVTPEYDWTQDNLNNFPEDASTLV